MLGLPLGLGLSLQPPTTLLQSFRFPSKKAMELVVVVPLDINCKSKGSPFKEIEGNGNQYPAHRWTWYPTTEERGYDMFGPEFLLWANVC